MADTGDRAVARRVEQLEPVASVGRALGAPAPQSEAPRRKRRPPWLLATLVLMPSALAALYFFVIASPIYVSEARFIVSSAARGSTSPLDAVMRGSPFGPGRNDSYAVNAYIMSRDAVRLLEREGNLRQVVGRPFADPIARHPRPWSGATFEELFRAYPRFVEVAYDATTGISTIRVRAFAAQDANTVAERLLLGAEGVVNRLNERSLKDTLSTAQSEVDRAQARLGQIQSQMTAFRMRERTIDPGRASVAGLEIATRLAGELAALRAQRAEIAASAPQSPQLPIIDNRIKALSDQIAREQASVAGSSDSLAPKVGEFDRLTLDREFANKQLASAMQSLEVARVEAQRQQLYLERISGPSMPDYPTLPKRLFGFLTVFLTTLLIYGIVKFLAAGLREHRQ